jgi:sestrin
MEATSCWCCPECIESRHQRHHDQSSLLSNGLLDTRKLQPEANLHLFSDDGVVDNEDVFDAHLEVSMLDMEREHYGPRTSQSSICSQLSASMEHVMHIMAYHPKYRRCFQHTHYYLMHEDGPLPFDYRHYIAIMAAARHHCSYLVSTQMTEFLSCGGDPAWLQGLQFAPKKLRNLNELNKILAHRPWLITRQHIECLRQGCDSWSVSELAHAVVLLAHFHTLSSFVHGCGIAVDGDRSSSSESSLSTSADCDHFNYASVLEVEGGIDTLIERMKMLNEDEGDDGMTQEELLRRFEKVETAADELNASDGRKSVREDMLCFIDDTEFTYQDFAKQCGSSGITTFCAQDYSWEEHGYSLANEIYMQIATLLDEKFQMTQNLTYFTMGTNTDIDTTSFRRAVWNYVHCIFGIRHDDYNYGVVNQLLEKKLRSFIKIVTCFPENTTHKDYNSFMTEFMPSEKVHVIIMILEARLQAELLYALHAVSRYMT